MADANWGRVETVTLPSMAEQSLDVLDAPYIASDSSEVTLVTLHLFRSYGQPAANANVYAEVQYSQGQASNTFRCDWLGQVSLPARSMVVRAVTYAPRAIESYSTGGISTRLGAMLAIGAARSAPLRYTSAWQLVSANTIAFAVPAFARRWRPEIMRYDADVAPHYFPVFASDVSDLEVTIGYWQGTLTPEMMTDGIDLMPLFDVAETVLGVGMPQTVQGSYLVRSVFELGL